MRNWKDISIAPSTAIRATLAIIDQGNLQIALVVDAEGKLIGTVTDGNVRRGILAGISLESPVSEIMNTKFTYAGPGDSTKKILQQMKKGDLKHIPVLDENGGMVRLALLADFAVPAFKEEWVVLMAGGLGTRLRPLTEDTPKPLLKVGSKPLLETTLEDLADHGFRDFFLSVNYRAEMIKTHFGNGSDWGVNIKYLNETTRLGTAGALSLLPEGAPGPILVMNADLLTKINYQHLLDYHRDSGCDMTMCVREYDFQVPYGVVKIEDDRVFGLEEKPIYKMFVNAGVYVIGPEAAKLVPKDTQFDMPALFEKVKEGGGSVGAFPIREYWLDIGHMEDFHRANREFGSESN